jgi:hypothetical protein
VTRRLVGRLPRAARRRRFTSLEARSTATRRRNYDLRHGQGDLREQGRRRPQVLGAHYGRYVIRIDANRPGVYRWLIALEGRSIRNGLASDRDQADAAVRRLGRVTRLGTLTASGDVQHPLTRICVRYATTVGTWHDPDLPAASWRHAGQAVYPAPMSPIPVVGFGSRGALRSSAHG